ncbi:MAG TPA: translation initiation factor IF-2 [Clostridia bacterium]|jgi:translation initiation factor IF-2|nr:translation initiation factor IF-2 [Clostridia bacterium]
MNKENNIQERELTVEETSSISSILRNKLKELTKTISAARMAFAERRVELERQNPEVIVEQIIDTNTAEEAVTFEELNTNEPVNSVDESKTSIVHNNDDTIPERETIYIPPSGGYQPTNKPQKTVTPPPGAYQQIPPIPTKPKNQRMKGRYENEDEIRVPKAKPRIDDYRSKNFNFDQEEEDVVKIKPKKSGIKKKNKFNLSEVKIIEHAVIDKSIISIRELSEKIGKTSTDIIKQLSILNIQRTINETIDFDTAELVAGELGVTLELQVAQTSEEKMEAFHDGEEDNEKDLQPRPPIVTIMGHVDHGKTSILDYIRKSHVARGEAGGITQHIGAYSVKTKTGKITFVDTPGHAAFTAMRERGANITDIVVIVVAADDGIMPQTIEAINHSKAAGVNIIVAINKIDKRDIDIDKTLTQISEQGLVPEEWGGDIPCIRVSAKTGEGIDDLLETIIVTSEVMELKANPNRKGRGTILEARLDPQRGPLATVIVQNGTLKTGDYIVAGTVVGKIRSMEDDKGKRITKADPSSVVMILGLKDVPNTGDNLLATNDEKLTKEVAEERIAKEKLSLISKKAFTLDDFHKSFQEGEVKTLNIIIKGDVQGSVEALKESLEQLSNDEVKVSTISAIPGAINESDVLLANTVNAVIIGFNVRPDTKAKLAAESRNVDIRLYRIIYDAIDDINNAIKGMLKPVYREEYLGKAEVRAVYKIPTVGQIAGSMVKDGKIVRNANVRVIRNDIIIADTTISSLKRLKDDAREVVAGFECGIGLKDFQDFEDGDIIESFKLVENQTK